MSSRDGNSSSFGSSQVVNELMVYLQIGLVEVPEDDTGFDLLAWWKASENRFPVLSTMARDLLIVPVSTIALEQAFSASE